MKAVLINPSIREKIWAGIPEMCSRNIFLFPPLGLMYIQSYACKHTRHQVSVIDALADGLNAEALRERLKSERPDVVGITALTHNLIEVANTIRAVKKADSSIRVCLGGPHVHSYPMESIGLKGVDFAVPGDGEITFAKLLDALEGGENFSAIKGLLHKKTNGEIVRTAADTDELFLDSLPFPDRKLNDFRKYYTPATEGAAIATLITARGCPQRCTFCNTYENYRPRGVKNIVDEIEDCIKIGVEEIFFLDDTFNPTVKRVTDIASEILNRKLKVKWGFKARCDQVTEDMLSLCRRAGCTKIHYGVETGTNEGLRMMNKKVTIEQIEQTFRLTKENGIRTIGFFMLGCPHEKNRQNVIDTIEFSKKLNADYAVFAIYSPYPDTPAFSDGVKAGVFTRAGWDEFIKEPSAGKDLPTCWEEHFTKKELIGLLRNAHRKFYFRPGIIAKNLFGFHSLSELKRTIGGGMALLKLEFNRHIERKI